MITAGRDAIADGSRAMAEWVEVLLGDTLTCIALVRGYSLTVVGGGDLWVWFIDRDGRNLTIGADETLATARIAAEATAYWLARIGGNPSG
jgi:hypothetical protein